MKKKKKIKNHRLYALVVLVLGIAIIVMSFTLLFHVQKIKIVGNDYVDSNDIAETIKKDKKATNTIYLVCKGKMGGFEFIPSIEKVKISFTAPWSVKIKVQEKKPVGAVMYDGEYYYFDQKGFVVHKDGMLLEDVPYIEELTDKKVKIYKELPVKDKSVIDTIVSLSGSLKKTKLRPDHIVCDGKEFSLYFDKIQVELGKKEMEKKINQLPSVLKELEGESGVLNMKHYSNSKDRISFEKNTETAETE